MKLSIKLKLIFWNSDLVEKVGLSIFGENALAAGVFSPDGWYHMQDALTYGHYQGITLLRLGFFSEQAPQKGLGSLSNYKAELCDNNLR